MHKPFNTETIEHCGVTVRIEYFYDDECRSAPWAEYDGNVNIKAPRNNDYLRYGTVKKPSEIIFHAGRGHDVYLYDIREAHKKARLEGWCIGCDWAQGLTKKQIAARAVAENVEMWRGWLNDAWFYAGVVCTVLNAEGEETEETDSCWGVETLNDYHETAGREMAEALAESTYKARLHQWRAALKEARARKYWASRDVETVGV